MNEKENKKTDAELEAQAVPPEEPDTEQVGGEDPLAALAKERDELFARLQRVSADYQNYMKRSAANLSDSVELARGDVLRQFVPVLDHFDKALGNEPKSEEAKALHDGLRIVRDELTKVLQQAGVERIEPKVGENFDPSRHEAMMQQAAEGVAPGSVSMVLGPGYAFGERVLRPAKVAVAPS